MIGYEARARITADVAGFVAAQRDGAQSATALSNAVQTLNTQLLRTENLATQAASSLRSFSQAAQQTSQRQGQAAGSATSLAQAMNQGAAAYNAAQVGAQQAAVAMAQNAAQQQQATQATNQNAQAQRQQGQSLKSLGQELARLIPQQQQFRAALAQGASLTREQGKAAAEVDQRLGQLTQQYVRLSATQRQTVNTHRDMAMASRLAAQATQEQAAAQTRLEQTGRLTNAQLQQLGRETAKLAAQRERLESSQRQGVVLNQQEANSLGALQGRLRELSGIYDRLSAEQKQVVTTARQLAQANQAVASSAQQAVAGSRAQQQAAEGLNRSLWSLRSAVGDATSSMQQLWSVSQQVTRALWDNYSAQEMAIAQIARVSGETTIELDRITDSVRRMSTEIPIAFEELAEIAMLGSQVGVATEALDTFTETVALFAATSEVSADATATMMARIMEMTNLNETHGLESVQNLGSAIAYLGSNALATDGEILKTVESIATMTSQVGFSAEATVGLGAAMASLVIKPEIARGASQRVFLQLGEAIQGTGSAMEKLVDITGMSQDALLELSKNDFEQYFFTVMEALGGVADRGEDLIPIIRELGVINTRDAEVVARLASNYDILSDSVGKSYENFANGQYLYEESEQIFNTLTARVQILANTWSNFMFSAVEAVAPFISSVVGAATSIIQLADSMGAAPVLGWGALILAAAGSVALLASGIGVIGQGLLAFRGLLNMVAGSQVAQTAATTAQTAATGRATAALTAYRLAGIQNVAVTSTLTATTAASGTAMQTFAARTAVATGAMRAFVLAHPAGIVLTLVAALVAGGVAWDAFSDSTERANAALLKSNEAHLNAAGGMQGLSNALRSDTEVWQNSRQEVYDHIDALDDSTSAWSSQAAEVERSSRFRLQAIGDLSAADAQAAKEAENLRRNQEDLQNQLGTTSDEVNNSSGAMALLSESTADVAQKGMSADNSIGQLNGSLGNTAESAEQTSVAIGLATRNVAALSLESAILESGLLANEKAFQVVKDSGVDFGSAVTMEMMNAGEGAEYLRGKASEIRSEFSSWDQVLTGLNEFTSNMVWDGWKPFTSDAIEAARSVDEFGNNLKATTLSIAEAARETQVLDDMFVTLPDGTRASTEQLAQFAEEGAEAAAMAEVMKGEVEGLGVSLETLHESFTSFYDPVTAWGTALSNANAEIDIQNEAIREYNSELDEGTVALLDHHEGLLSISGGFSLFLDELEKANEAQVNWADNLLRLGQNGDIPAEVVAGLAEMGVEGAEIVEGLANANETEVARFVASWDGGMGATSESFTVMFSDFLSQAMSSGDQGGVDFVRGLMEKVANGDLEFREAVDLMTEYAEKEFQDADTTNQPMLDNTQALLDLTALIDKAERDARNANVDVEPEVETKSFWDQLSSLWDNIKNWWGSGPNLSVSPQTSGYYGGSGSYGALPKKDGGWIDGPGGPRQDNIPVAASSGEFVVNAASAARNAQLLEWINNDGNMPSRQEFVPQIGLGDNMRRTPPASSVRSMPDYGQTASAGVRRQSHSERIVVNVKNYYPQAEPTSVTTNRALQYVAGLNGVL